MTYTSTADAVKDLEHHGHLVRVREEVDPYLEVAAIQRRVFAVSGPALYFENLKGCRFPAVSNLYGSKERIRFLFRHTLKQLEFLIKSKADPFHFSKDPMAMLGGLPSLRHAHPIPALRPAVLKNQISLDQLPKITCWPKDGGPFITLPQVYSEDAHKPGLLHSNLGMYRIQIEGGGYQPNQEVGLHYQLNRGLGIHHSHAKAQNQALRVSIFVGGPPAHTLAAIMPLPEGLPELLFAGILGGRAFRYAKKNSHIISADADFCITGVLSDDLKPEGPFGDHLGYYSLQHEFPYLKVDGVYHRNNAVWPFTVVGRPPQEDTLFGDLIHEITAPMIPASIPGLKSVHAVDAAGVHPLLLAIGSERYFPLQSRRPQEILSIANAILGFGQLNLAKYLMIIAGEDNPNLSDHNIDAFFEHFLERVDWTRDLHFQTRTTMDTLDYSGGGLNEGSKVVMCAVGAPRRSLQKGIPESLNLPAPFSKVASPLPGVLCIQAPPWLPGALDVKSLEEILFTQLDASGWPLVIVCDDAEFCAASMANFLWVTFIRSNPSHDIFGAGSFTDHKHWGCQGSLIIDARIKDHHADLLVEAPGLMEKVDRLGTRGHSLHRIL
jgi:4-hydroxy-3-polyprenylbenzoate decarboxylase